MGVSELASAIFFLCLLLVKDTITTECKWEKVNKNDHHANGPSRLDNEGFTQLYPFHPDSFEAKTTSKEMIHKVHLRDDRIRFSNGVHENGKKYAFAVKWARFPGEEVADQPVTTNVYLSDAGSCDVKEWNINNGNILTVSTQLLH